MTYGSTKEHGKLVCFDFHLDARGRGKQPRVNIGRLEIGKPNVFTDVLRLSNV